MLDRLVVDTRAGQSRVLVLRGEAGIGRTALLGLSGGRRGGMPDRPGAGVESEMELAFAGLHALCAPLLDHLGHLPGPQRDALEHGVRPAAPDRRRIASSSGWRC